MYNISVQHRSGGDMSIAARYLLEHGDSGVSYAKDEARV